MKHAFDKICEALGHPGILDEIYHQMMRALALAAWRSRQDIIRLDPELAFAIAGTKNTLVVPSRLSLRLPAWSVYFDCAASVASREYYGFFALLDHVDLDKTVSADEDALFALALKIIFVAEDSDYILNFNLNHDSILESLKHNSSNLILDPETQEPREVEAEELIGPDLLKALNIILYACMHGFGDTQEYDGKQQSASAKKTKKGWRLFPSQAPKYHVMGQRLGDHLRRIRQSGAHQSRGSVMPHVRAAHWHNYWIGPMNDPEKRSLDPRWLYPIPVNLKPDDDSAPGW